MSWSLFSGLARDSSVAASIFAKASFVGAKTVKGPGPDSVSTRSAAWRSPTSVEKVSVLPNAISTMFWVGAGASSVATGASSVVSYVDGVRCEREREGDNTLHACKIDLRETG